jgi:hypothetical protein
MARFDFASGPFLMSCHTINTSPAQPYFATLKNNSVSALQALPRWGLFLSGLGRLSWRASSFPPTRDSRDLADKGWLAKIGRCEQSDTDAGA